MPTKKTPDPSVVASGTKILIEEAQKGSLASPINYRLFYQKLRDLHKEDKVPYRGISLANFLNTISENVASKNNGLILTTLVVNKTKKIPTSEYFKLVKKLRGEDIAEEDKKRFWDDEFKKVINHTWQL